MRIKSQRDFCAGVMFSTFGIAFALGATSYEIGSGARMGPGYFPLIVGVLIAITGTLITVKALTIDTEDGEPVGAIAWRPLAFIIAANLIFGMLLGGMPGLGIPRMGLIVAIYALIFVASLAGDEFNFRSVFVLATVLALGTYLVLVVALKLQFPVWPAFITD